MLKSLMATLAGILWEKYLQPWLDQKVKDLVDTTLPQVMEKLASLFPMLIASAGKTIVEAAFRAAPGLPNVTLPDVKELTEQVIDKAVESDPDIPGISDVIDLSEMFRKWREGRA